MTAWLLDSGIRKRAGKIMSWTDIFKSKSSMAAPDPRIRWFGKLPTYPDYYRSPTDEDWADEFNSWLLKGFELFRGRASGDGRGASRLPVSACILRLPKSGMTVLASILDYGGDLRGRPFPFCFYAGVPTSCWPGPTSDRFASAARVIERLLDLDQEVARFLNQPGRFEAVFADREVDVGDLVEGVRDSSWISRGKSLPMADWFVSARAGLATRDGEAWSHLARAWGANIMALEGHDFQPTLRFPLAAKTSLETQGGGWFRWLERRMDLSRRDLSVVMTGDLARESGSLTIIARDPMPDDFLLFTASSKTLPYLDDLSAVATRNPEDGEVSDTPLPGGPDPSWGSWSEFVEAGIESP